MLTLFIQSLERDICRDLEDPHSLLSVLPPVLCSGSLCASRECLPLPEGNGRYSWPPGIQLPRSACSKIMNRVPDSVHKQKFQTYLNRSNAWVYFKTQCKVQLHNTFWNLATGVPTLVVVVRNLGWDFSSSSSGSDTSYTLSSLAFRHS